MKFTYWIQYTISHLVCQEIFSKIPAIFSECAVEEHEVYRRHGKRFVLAVLTAWGAVREARFPRPEGFSRSPCKPIPLQMDGCLSGQVTRGTCAVMVSAKRTGQATRSTGAVTVSYAFFSAQRPCFPSKTWPLSAVWITGCTGVLVFNKEGFVRQGRTAMMSAQRMAVQPCNREHGRLPCAYAGPALRGGGGQGDSTPCLHTRGAPLKQAIPPRSADTPRIGPYTSQTRFSSPGSGSPRVHSAA